MTNSTNTNNLKQPNQFDEIHIPLIEEPGVCPKFIKRNKHRIATEASPFQKWIVQFCTDELLEPILYR